MSSEGPSAAGRIAGGGGASARPLRATFPIDPTLLLAVAGFGLCMIGFGLSRTLWLSVLFLLLSAAFLAAAQVVVYAGAVMVLDGYPLAQRVGSAAGQEMNAASSPAHAWEFGLARVLDALALTRDIR